MSKQIVYGLSCLTLFCNVWNAKRRGNPVVWDGEMDSIEERGLVATNPLSSISLPLIYFTTVFRQLII